MRCRRAVIIALVVELAPDDIEVRVLRGVFFRPISQQMPPPFSERMLEEARSHYRLIETRLRSTEYARRAALWLQTRQPLPIAQTMCVGCHVD